MSVQTARPRRALWFVAYAFFAVMLGTTLTTPLYPIYQRQYGFTQLLITVVFATYAVSVIGGLFVFGRLSDEIGRRPLLIAGIVCSALSAVAFLIAGGLLQLLVGRTLSGFSAAIFTGTATAAMVDLVPGEERLRATAMAVAANLGGLGAGNLLSGVLAESVPFPLRTTFAVDLLLVLLAGLVALLVPETVKHGAGRFRLQRLAVPAEVRGAFLPAAIAGFCGFAVSGVFGSVVPAFLARDLHLPNHTLVGAIVFTLFAASAAGQLLVGRLSERVALPVGCAGLIAGTGLLGLAVGVRVLWPLLVAAPVLGLGQGLVMGAGLGAINKRAPQRRRGEVASTYFIVLYVGLVLPVVAAGLAADAYGFRAAGIAFTAAAACVVVAVLGWLLRRPAEAR